MKLIILEHASRLNAPNLPDTLILKNTDLDAFSHFDNNILLVIKDNHLLFSFLDIYFILLNFSQYDFTEGTKICLQNMASPSHKSPYKVLKEPSNNGRTILVMCGRSLKKTYVMQFSMFLDSNLRHHDQSSCLWSPFTPCVSPR